MRNVGTMRGAEEECGYLPSHPAYRIPLPHPAFQLPTTISYGFPPGFHSGFGPSVSNLAARAPAFTTPAM